MFPMMQGVIKFDWVDLKSEELDYPLDDAHVCLLHALDPTVIQVAHVSKIFWRCESVSKRGVHRCQCISVIGQRI